MATMGLLAAIKDFFLGMFSRNPEEVHRRRELKRIASFLSSIRPTVWKQSQKAVLPGFADTFLTYCQLLKPVADIVRKTVASQDVRQSQRFYDLLIDTRLPVEERERKIFFGYEGMADRVSRAVHPEDEIESVSREFLSFMKVLDSPEIRVLDTELLEMERLVDICRHDYERILGLFDPGVNLDNPSYRPEFSPVPGESLLPELIDFHYISHDFWFTTRMEDNLSILLSRLAPEESGGSNRLKLQKFLSALNKILKNQLGSDMLLALMRAIKADPVFSPPLARERRSFLESYKNRVYTQFQKDKERILRERHESAITHDINALFGDMEIMEMESYNETNAALLARESPDTFAHVKPMRILKTFIYSIFDPRFREPVKRLLVEGYFDNKAFQNNLANVFFQCEHSGERFQNFEEQIGGNGRISVIAIRRYIEEAKRGKDVAVFLGKQTDTINNRAREILENETNLFGMLGEALADIVADFKRSTPEIVTNIRTLGAGRNRDLMGHLANGVQDIQRLIKIMKNFTFIKQPQAAAEQAAELEDV